MRIGLDQLRRGAVEVHRFPASGAVLVRYALPRPVMAAFPAALRVVQRLDHVVIDQASTPFGGATLMSATAASHTSCGLTTGVGEVCGVLVSIAPYVAYSSGRFSDVVCCGPSGPITVSFAAPVDTVVVTIYDPTYARNHMVGYGDSGPIRVDFASSGVPGYDVPDTQILVGSGIDRVDLVPSTGIASGDWVVGYLSFGGVGARIVVECTSAQVLRGQPVQCRARAPDPASQLLVMSEWRFESGKLSQAITHPTIDTMWGGPVVVDGTVRARGQVNGKAASGSARLSVTPRTWSADTVQFRVINEGMGALPPRPTKSGDLGVTVPTAGDYAPAGFFAQVDSGPNQGVLYAVRVPVSAEAKISINTTALRDSSDFYFNQPIKRKNQSGGRLPICARSEVAPFLPKVQAHEGLTMVSTSHAATFRRILNEQVPQATEGVVALRDLALFLDKVKQAAAPGINDAKAKSQDTDRPGGTVNPVPVTCTFNYF
jgi:hypothetical protein